MKKKWRKKSKISKIDKKKREEKLKEYGERQNNYKIKRIWIWKRDEGKTERWLKRIRSNRKKRENV